MTRFEPNTAPTIAPHPLFQVWSPDTVAECMEGVFSANGLYERLWRLIPLYEGKRPTDCGDNFSELALARHWNALSADDQTLLNTLAVAHEAQYERAEPEAIQSDADVLGAAIANKR